MLGRTLFDVGANYLNKFGDFTVALYGAFAYASFVPGYSPFAASANQATGANLTSWKQWVLGAQFGYAGFTVGGAVGYDNNGARCELLHRRRQRHPLLHRGHHVRDRPVADVVHVGRLLQHQRQRLGERLGDRHRHPSPDAHDGWLWRRSGRQQHVLQRQSRRRLWPSAQETINKWEIGANYALGPGVKLTGGAMMYTAGGPTNAVSGNSWVFLLGMDLRF